VIKIFIEVINEDQRRITISGLEPESDFICGQDEQEDLTGRARWPGRVSMSYFSLTKKFFDVLRYIKLISRQLSN